MPLPPIDIFAIDEYATVDQAKSFDLGAQANAYADTTSRQLAGGIDESQQNLYGFVNLVGEVVGSDYLKETGEEGVLRNAREAAANLANYDSMEDIGSMGDVFAAIGEQAIRAMPELATDAAIALGAAATAIPSGGASVAGASSMILGKAIVKEAGKSAARSRAEKAGLSAMFVSQAGEARNQSLEEGINNPFADLGVGAVNTALDAAPIKLSLDALLKTGKPSTDSIVKTLTNGIGKKGLEVGAVGAVTEPLQELTHYISMAAQKDDYDVMSDDNIDKMLFASMTGGGVSGIMGSSAQTASNVAGVFTGGTDNPVTDEYEDILNTKVESDNYGGQEADINENAPLKRVVDTINREDLNVEDKIKFLISESNRIDDIDEAKRTEEHKQLQQIVNDELRNPIIAASKNKTATLPEVFTAVLPKIQERFNGLFDESDYIINDAPINQDAVSAAINPILAELKAKRDRDELTEKQMAELTEIENITGKNYTAAQAARLAEKVNALNEKVTLYRDEIETDNVQSVADIAPENIHETAVSYLGKGKTTFENSSDIDPKLLYATGSNAAVRRAERMKEQDPTHDYVVQNVKNDDGDVIGQTIVKQRLLDQSTDAKQDAFNELEQKPQYKGPNMMKPDSTYRGFGLWKDGQMKHFSFFDAINKSMRGDIKDGVGLSDDMRRRVGTALQDAVTELMVRGYELPKGHKGQDTLNARLQQAVRQSIQAKYPNLKGSALQKKVQNTVVFSNGSVSLKLKDLATVKYVAPGKNVYTDQDGNPVKGKGGTIDAMPGRADATKQSDMLEPMIDAAKETVFGADKSDAIDVVDAGIEVKTKGPSRETNVIDNARAKAEDLLASQGELTGSDLVKEQKEINAEKNEQAASNMNMDGTNKAGNTKKEVKTISRSIRKVVDAMAKHLGVKSPQIIRTFEQASKITNSDLKATIIADMQAHQELPMRDKEAFARVYYADEPIIYVSPEMPDALVPLAIAHELGHAFLKNKKDTMTPAMQKRANIAYKQHLKKHGLSEKEYSKTEWFSDQVALHMLDVPVAKNGISAFFAKLAKVMRGMAKAAVDHIYRTKIERSDVTKEEKNLWASRIDKNQLASALIDSMLNESADLNARRAAFRDIGTKDKMTKEDVVEAMSLFEKIRTFVTTPAYREKAITKAQEAYDGFITKGDNLYAKAWVPIDTRLRNIGKAGTPQKKAAMFIADNLFTPVNRRAKGGYANTVNASMGMWLGEYDKITRDLPDEKVRKILSFLQSEKDTSLAPADIKPYVARMRHVHKRFYEEVVGSIHETTSAKEQKKQPVKNHFPREYDINKIIDNRADFEALIDKHAKRTNTKIDAAATTDYIIDILTGEKSEPIDARPTKSNANQRSLGFIPGEEIQAFLSDDLDGTLNSYVQQMVKRQEFESRFGGFVTDENGNARFDPRAKLDDALQQLDAKDAARVEEYVQSYLGAHNQHKMSATMKGNQALAMSMVNASWLWLSSIWSLVELGQIPVRMKDTPLKDVLKMARSRSMKEQIQRARDMGLTDERLMQQLLNSTFGSPSSGTWSGRAADKVNSFVFKYNGQQFFTAGLRAIAANLGEQFIVEHATKAKEGDAKSKQYIAELIGDQGIDASIDAIIQWDADGRPTVSADSNFRTKRNADGTKTKVSNEVLIQHMLSRFVDEAVMRPNAGQRPLWSSDPRFAMLSHLKPYFFAVQHTILPQLIEAAKKTNMGNLHAATPLLAVALFMLPLAIAAAEIREIIKWAANLGDHEPRTHKMSGGELLMNAVTSSNLFFGFEPIRSSLEYGTRGDNPLIGIPVAMVPTLSYAKSMLNERTDRVVPFVASF